MTANLEYFVKAPNTRFLPDYSLTVLTLKGGYHDQLCCDQNEICYTAPNLQASCKPTAPPGSPTTIIDISLSFKAITSVETIVETATETANRTNLRTQTSIYTDTTVKTSQVTLVNTSVTTYTPTEMTTHVVMTMPSQPISTPAASSGNFNSTLTSTKEADSWPSWEEGTIGGASGAAAIFLVLVIGIWYWRRRQTRRAEEQFANMQRDGAGTFRMMDTAQIPDSQSSQRARSDGVAPSLLPPKRPRPFGRNPYDPPAEDNDGPPWDPDNIPAPPCRSMTGTPRQASDRPVGPPGAARLQRQSNLGSMHPDARRQGAATPSRISRRPVESRRPLVEDYNEE